MFLTFIKSCMPYVEIIGWTPPHENWGTSQAACTLIIKFADTLRLWALFVLSTRPNCGKSQAFCTPMMEIPDSLRL